MVSLLCTFLLSALVHLPNGDAIPDYSTVGYRWGDKEIPTVEVTCRLSAPSDGSDATQLIQDAIDSMPAPGALLLAAGTYNVYGTINICRSGIVIRGEGKDKTIINAAGAKQRSLFKIGTAGGLEINRDWSSRSRVSDIYVPYGSMSVPVEHPENFASGDRIILHETHNQAWIHAIRMDRIMQFNDRYDRCVLQWTPEMYSYEYERVVSKVEGNMLHLDAPVILAVYPEYGGAEVYKYSCNRIDECGVEYLSAISEYDHSLGVEDELHAWRFVEFCAAEHCWTRECSCKHFGYSLATTSSESKNITVTDCQSSEPISHIKGARRYGLDCCGQLALFKNCSLDKDRHGMVTHSNCAGPNAYVNCVMTNAFEDAGPHNNWGVGTLHDCCKTNGDINVQDRQGSGVGHGWAGASVVMWNCEAKRICAQSVWGIHNNYIVGCIAQKWPGWYGCPADEIQNKYRNCIVGGVPEDYEPRPEAVFVSHGKHVKPYSLYESQLTSRRKAGVRAVPEEYYVKEATKSFCSTGHEMVDLGLSVKWASCNIDASAPEQCGGYYSWGEIETKNKYTFETYKWCKGTSRSLTKYCDNPEYGFEGFTDDRRVLEAEDDVASVKWGDGWRIPTEPELKELLVCCKWEYVKVGEMECYKVTGPSGNSIILPMGGNMSSARPSATPEWYNQGATYITSSLSSKHIPVGAGGCFVYSGSYMMNDLRRAGGRMIRPVHD